MVREARQLALEPLLIPARVALRTEEDGALVVVEAMDVVVPAREVAQTSLPMRPLAPVTSRTRLADMD